jgi:hypothetical protein
MAKLPTANAAGERQTSPAGRKAAARSDPDFRKAVLSQLSIWASEKPQEVVIAPASDPGKALTRADVREHVKKRTKLGKELELSWMNAAIRSVLAAKK